MASGLAAQLAQSSSLNASLYIDRSRRKFAESYLFSDRDANQHDFYSLHALGLNGLLGLKALDTKFEKYENTIFSDSSRNVDRTLQSRAQNEELDKVLNDFLKKLGPYLMEAPTSKALEWVIRRFRVNEFNIDALMTLFLPYHETPHFTKLVSILHIETDLWRFLIPLKNAAQSLPRTILVNEMVKDRDLARFVFNLLPESLENGWYHPALIGFTAGVAVEYIARQKHIKEDTLTFIMSTANTLCGSGTTPECVLVGYTMFAALSHQCRLKPDVLVAIIGTMLVGQTRAESTQFVSFAVGLLAPQDQMEDLPDPIINQIMILSRLPQYFTDCLKWVGSERLIIALIPGFLRRIKNPQVIEILDSLLLSPNIPSSVMETLIRGLLHACDPAVADSRQMQFLRTIYQVHATPYSQVVSDVMNETQDNGKREKLENITRLVTLPAMASNDIGQLILSSHLEEANTRQLAVRDLIRRLKEADLDLDARKDIQQALLDRVCDDQIAVIENLYESPSTVLPIFNNVSFIMTVSKALVSSDLPRDVMRLHFDLMAGPFFEKYPDLAPAIFENIFLPFILYTKPRQKATQLVWDTLKNSPFASYELLSGCEAILSKHTIEKATRIDDMAKLDLAIATRIAENILSSNSFSNHLDMLLRLVRCTDAYTRNMSYLISRFLLNLLSGAHQLEMAQRLLAAMDVQFLSDMQGVFSGKTNIQEVITDEALSKAIVVKPNSSGTAHHLQLSILALIPVLKRPAGVVIQWLPNGTSTLTDKRGITFAALMQDMYRLINTSTGHELCNVLLKALFVNLREEVLLLLVGVWVHCMLNPTPDSEHLFQTALFHTLAFLRAQVEDSDSPQDFQTIVPALLIALHSGTKSIRSTVMDCIAVIAQSTSSSSASAVYAVDTIYGEKTGANLQYLEWSDFGRFMTSVGSYHKHCTNDKDYLNVVVQDLLQGKRSDNKKDASYKKKILCYLLSHVLAWDNLEARIALLRMFRNVSHGVKLTMLSPILQSFISADRLSLSDGNQELVLQYWQLLLRSYDLTSVSELGDPDQRDILLKLIRASFANNSTPQAILTSIFAQLNGDVFGQFPSDLQQEYCVILIESATATNSLKSLIKENFGPLLKKADLIVSLLSHFQPAAKDPQQRAYKRAKMSNNPSSVISEYLTTLAEILVAYPMPGSPELLSQLLDTLAAIHQGQSFQSDTHYTTQLFMTIIESTTSSIPDVTKLTPNTLRMEILVELLRTSDNPQTFNQASLVIASIARVAPEFVMQNVMPIFTFMGSNVFHRDDSYSFRVVQKTIDSIVPVVVDSLKKKHTGPFDLLKASTDFLRVFTDAATHVPRHRRTQFFIHFVDILGRDDFLIPVCLLLIEKSHRVVRQKASEVAGTLGLPVAIIQSQNKTPPFKVIYQLLREATNLYSAFTSSEPSHNVETFLDISKDETTAKMQINAIVLFVDVLLQQSIRTGSTTDTISINDSITLLLGIANTVPADSESPIPQYLDLSRTAIRTLGHLLDVISVSEFISSIDVILKSNNNLTETGALNLLASRLANVSPKTRLDIAPTLIDILNHICAIIENGEDATRVKAALAACQSIAHSAVDQELPSLAKAVPVMLKTANRIPQVTSSVFKCIVPLSTKLGPRILPVFRDVVRFCVDVLRNTVPTTDDGKSVPQKVEVMFKGLSIPEKEKHSLETDARLILTNILSAIPQFWTVDDLVGLVGLVLEFPADTVELRKTLTKRVPSQQLLSALLRVWSRSIPHHFKETFFDLLKRVMRNSERSVVHENLRDVFKLFLEAFEDLQIIKKDFSNLENFCLASFVEFVTKLNETTFRPLYRRLFDWAFNDPSENRINRQITFCLALTSLIKLLKDLVTPYLDIALSPLLDLLDAEREPSFELWSVSIELLNISLISDEGAFWKLDKLNKLAPRLIKQIENYVSLFSKTDGAEPLQACLTNLVSVMDDELSLKKLHLDILMQTRSEDSRVRLFTLEILVSLWESQGEKLTGFLTDIITFIVECAEDENDNVSKAARSLKRGVEKRTGSLDALLGK